MMKVVDRLGLMTLMFVLLLSMPALAAEYVAESTDHAGAEFIISEDSTIAGYHYNISTFRLEANSSLNVTAYNGTSWTGWAKINASKIYIYGTLDADGLGFGGGSGGSGGSGNDGDGSPAAAGTAGTGTDQNGSDGSTGSQGTTFGCDAGTAGAGGAGGDGYNGTTGGASAGSSNACAAVRDGGPGDTAIPNNDSTTAYNATWGNAGGGGAGGTGGARQSGNDGGGGGGGGMGGDGGGYFIFIGKNLIEANNTINIRSGQNASCDAATNGNTGETGDNAFGGDGAANTQPNCARTTGGTGGSSFATGGTGGDGGAGGYGAGGAITFVSYNINLSGSTINVSGGDGTSATGGTIKVLYTNTATNGTYASGYSSLVYSSVTDAYFQDTIILTVADKTLSYLATNGTLVTDANATDPENATITYSITSTNFSKIEIDNVTGEVTLNETLTQSDIGSYTATIQASDGTDTVTDDITITVQNYPPTSVASINYNASNISYEIPWQINITPTDQDGTTVNITKWWYVNGTLNTTTTNTSISSGTTVSESFTIGSGLIGQRLNLTFSITDGIDTTTNQSFYVDVIDGRAPSASCSLSTSSGTVGVPFTISCTIDEVDTMDIVRVYINDSNGPVTGSPFELTNTSVQNGSTHTYEKVYTPNGQDTYSIWQIRMRDESAAANEAYQALSLSYASTLGGGAGGGGGGGGGGGTTIINGTVAKATCDIRFFPSIVTIFSEDPLVEVTVRNDDERSFNPVFQFKKDGEVDITDQLKITNPITSILQDRSDSFGIQYSSTGEENYTEATAVLLVSSSECEAIEIPITVVRGSEPLIDQLSFKLLSEPVFGQKAPLFTVGVLIGITLLIFAAIMSRNLVKSFQDRKPVQIFLWVFFLFLVSGVVDFVIIIAGRSMIGG